MIMFAKRVSFVAIPAAVVLGFIGFAPSASAAPSAEVTLNFVGLNCEGCTVTYTPDSGATGQPATIKNGSATFTSESGKLAPGYFAIDGDRFANLNAETTISFLYKGTKSGSTVSRSQALSAKKVFPCWAGTDATAEFTVRVGTVTDRNALGKNKRAVIAWVQPTPAATDVSGTSYPADRGRFILNGDITCSSKNGKNMLLPML
jgi:aminopeptidase N